MPRGLLEPLSPASHQLPVLRLDLLAVDPVAFKAKNTKKIEEIF